ncbi:MAG: hypothetical protein ISR72_10680 [Methylobacter sp.]|nr:hypothetical protein [Methylobacter sp.]
MIMRIIGYGAAAVIVLLLLKMISSFGIAQHMVECFDKLANTSNSNDKTEYSPLKEAQNMDACLQQKSNFIEKLTLRSYHKIVQALSPNAPCQYVGIWSASQANCIYEHSLYAEGRFISRPISCSVSSDEFFGEWSIQQNKMVWFPAEGVVWPPDINSMESVTPTSFVLVERNGSSTQFTKVSDLQSDLCP